MIRWTDERVTEVIAYMAGGLRDGAQAAKHFSEKWGVPLNSATIRGAVQRYRKAAAEAADAANVRAAVELDAQAAEGLAPEPEFRGKFVDVGDAERRFGPLPRAPEVKPEHIPAATGNMQRILFVPDTHAPFHDVRAWSLMMRAARVFQPDIIVHLGDLVDCYSLSHYPKSPERRETFEQELASANKCLDDLDSLGATKKTMVSGNHEARLTAYLTQKAPELYNMMSMRELLKMDARGWEWHEYRTHTNIGHMNITHDEGNYGKFAVHHARATFGGNVVIGHTHRMGVHCEGNSKGRSHVGACFGWLGDSSKIDYMHKVRAHAWQLGFGIGHMEENGIVHLQAIPIIDYRCVLNGRLFEVAA